MGDPVERMRNRRLIESLLKIRDLVGTMASSQTLQEEIPGFKTRKGIYKPQNSDFALWIRQTIKGTYPDQEPVYLPDGSWLYKYTPEAKAGQTDLGLSTNKALLNSKDHGVPVGVFIQREISGLKRTYEVLGLAYVEDFDGTHFIIHGEPIDVEDEPMLTNAIKPFEPFETDSLRLYDATSVMRKRAFQTAVRRIYHEKCSLCELGYKFHGQPIGVEAAHVIPVNEKGTSKDVRNGILLCKNHHDLFDRYLWAFDEDYRVHVAIDSIFRKSAEQNHVLKVEGKKLPNLPDEDYDLPDPVAINFRFERFQKFS